MRDSTWHLALLALLLGFLSWYMVSFEQEVASTAEVRLEFTGKLKNLVVRRGGLLDRITVVVRGPRSLVRSLDSTKLGYPVDLSSLRQGENVVVFDPDKLPLAGGLRVTDIDPQRMTITAEELATRFVPVHVRWTGELDKIWELKKTDIIPDTILLSGPKSLVTAAEAVNTAEVAVEDAKPRAVETTVGLEPSGELVAQPAEVDVGLLFGPKTADVKLKVDLEAQPTLPKGVKYSPGKMRLQLEAPVWLVDSRGRATDELEKAVKAFVALPPDAEPGDYEIEPVIHLPEDTTLLEASPATVRVTVP